MEVCAQPISTLLNLSYSSSARSDVDKFMELYRKYREVRNDLQEIGRLNDLENHRILRTLAVKIPGDAVKLSYARCRAEMKKSNAKELEIWDQFMSD